MFILGKLWFTVTSVTLNTLNSILEHHWCVTRISYSSVFAVFAKMTNLWLCTMDSMNSEEHSEVFVDVNDQRDWSVADDNVEAFIKARFRVSSMTDDEV